MNFKVAVFGCGYVGSELIKALVECGDEVLGLDPNQEKLNEIAETLSLGQVGERLTLEAPSEDLPKGVFDFVIITVPTPLGVDGSPNLEFVEQAAEVGVKLLTPNGVIILESTSYPGTTRQVLENKLTAGPGYGQTKPRGFGFSSERIDPGNTKFGLRNVPKVISGSDKLTLDRIHELYSRFVDVVVRAATIEDAEMSKVLENTYRAVNIALVNSLARVSGGLGVNIHEAIRLASTKPFGFQGFIPGIGVGGHCIPIDPVYLNNAVMRTSGSTIEIIDKSVSVNSEMPGFTAKKAVGVLKDLGVNNFEDAKILIFGVSYKPNSSDTRESAALDVIHEMQKIGFKGLHVFDDQVRNLRIGGLTVVNQNDIRSMSFDLCLNLTLHDSWPQLSSVIEARVLLDCWNSPADFKGRVSGLFQSHS